LRAIHAQSVNPSGTCRLGTLTVYRCVRNQRHRLGVCWTLDPDVALGFAARFAGHGRSGIVYAAEIDSRWVLAYFTSRNEAEVIVRPEMLSNVHRVGKTSSSWSEAA
jgi:hypothetical protein